MGVLQDNLRLAMQMDVHGMPSSMRERANVNDMVLTQEATGHLKT